MRGGWPTKFSYWRRSANFKNHMSLGTAMREVHTNIPSTVTRVKHFGPGGREAMLRAIAFSKARKGA